MRFALAPAAVLLLAACGTQPVAHGVAGASPASAARIALASATPDFTYPPANGTPVAAEILPPAAVLPAVALCTTPLEVFQDGNAGPNFCRNGALNVDSWNWYWKLQPPVMAAGPGLSPADQKAALCAAGPAMLTNVESERAYWMAAAYYGWTPIDAGAILMNGCR